MRRAACFVALFACVAASAAFAADDAVVFRSDVSLVRVDTQVVDRDNRAVTGLRAEDFMLREEGRTQPIRNFASENMPIDVLLLLDVSASMKPHVERIGDAAHQALRVLRDNDRVAIMVFDRSTRVRLGFRSDRAAVEREFESLLRQETFRGGTDITRAMYDGVNYVRDQGRRDARRAIVILTDDQTERNRDEEGVERALAKADMVMSALIAPDAMANRRMGSPGGGGSTGPTMGGGLGGIIFGQPRGGYGGRRGGGPGSIGPRTQSAGTAEIARSSGGDSMPVDDSYALESTLERIRQRYALYFNLPAGARSGDQRSISLDLSDAARRRYPYAELKYRREYYVPAGMKGAPAGAEPVEITRAPSGPDDDRPILRRPAVSQGATGGKEGPMSTPAPAPAASGSPSSAPAAAASAPASPTPAASSGTSSQPGTGGWRKLKPGEQPQ